MYYGKERKEDTKLSLLLKLIPMYLNFKNPKDSHQKLEKEFGGKLIDDEYLPYKIFNVQPKKCNCISCFDSNDAFHKLLDFSEENFHQYCLKRPF